MKKNTLRKFLSLALAMIMVLGLAACGGDKSTTGTTDTTKTETNENGTAINPGVKEEVQETDVVKKELIIGDGGYTKTFDPSASSGLTHLMIQNLVGDTLTAWDPITNELVGELAESWEWVDTKTLQLNIRQGVKFHNGNDLKANDVAFSIQHVKESVCAICYVWIDSTTIVDDYTIQLNLNDPAQDLIQEFAVSCFRILDEETCTEDPENGVMIGTGPYVLDSYEFNNYTTMTRFDGYWGEKPATEKITFKVMPEASSRLIALQNGEIDVCLNPAASELINVESDPNLKLFSTTGITMRYLSLNLENPKFADERVRQAVAHAIDKESIIAIAAEGHGSVAHTVIPDSTFGADKTVNPYNYDLEKAKSLLEEAGAVGTTITILAYGDLQALQAQVIQGNLNAVGFKCEVERVESVVMWERIDASDFDAVLYNWAGAMMGPDNSMRPLFHSAGGANTSRMYDAEFDEMLRVAMCEGDSAKRAELYSEVQRYLLSVGGPIPLYWDDVYVATSANVKNFIINSGAFHEFGYVYAVE